jgi:hypothetical protein
MNETECAALVAGDTISDPQGILQVLFNDTTHKKVTVSMLHSKEGTMSYDSLGDASIISVGGGGGDGAPPSGDYVAKTGDTMSGPLAIAMDTLPELHITSVAGDFSLDLSSGELKFSRTADATGLTMTTYGYSARGSSGEGGNKTDLGLNYIGIANKSYLEGSQIISLLQQSNGELALARGATQIYLTDFVNGRLAVDLSNCVQKSGDTMTGTLTVLGPEQYLLCENPSTGEQVMISPANIFFKRPEFNAAFFLRAGEGGNLYFQDQATGKVIQLTDLAGASVAVSRATVKELVREVLRELLAI